MIDKIVYRNGSDIVVLDLSAEGYGHERGADIVHACYGKGSRTNSLLFCATCDRAVYLREGGGKRLHGVHMDQSECAATIAAAMSDEHKRQTEYVVRAAAGAGHKVETEFSTGTGVRPDVVIRGQCDIAVEVQRSSLSVRQALARTAKTLTAGLATSVWISDRDYTRKPAWFDQVPSVGVNQDLWDAVPPRRSVTALGLREIVPVRCESPDITNCPRTGRRPCGGWHVMTTPWRRMTLDDVAEMAPEGGIVPLNWFDKFRFLVSPESAKLYEEFTGRSALWTPQVEQPGERQPRKHIECVRRPAAADQCCGKRAPEAAGGPLKLFCQLCPASQTYWRGGPAQQRPSMPVALRSGGPHEPR